MTTVMNFGGWLPNRLATGQSLNCINVVGWAATTLAVLAAVGTGGELPLEHLERVSSNVQTTNFPVIGVENFRTASEDLIQIRKVLSPAISDLATTFNVTRQSIYNWLNGEPITPENAARLRDLAQAADVLEYKGIAVNPMLLKRKFSNGKTLFQVAQANESAHDAAILLSQIIKIESEQQEKMKARFANRNRSSATADFDLPASNNHG